MTEPNTRITESPRPEAASSVDGTGEGGGAGRAGWSPGRVVTVIVAVALLSGGTGFYFGSKRAARLARELPSERRIIPVKELLKPIVQVAGRELAIDFINGKAPFKLEIRIGDRAPILTETAKSRSKIPIGEPPATGEPIRVTAIDATGQRVTQKIKAPY